MPVNMGAVWDRASEFLVDNMRAYLPVALLAILVPQAISDILQIAGDSVGRLAAQLAGLVMTLIALWGQLFVVALALDPAGGRNAARTRATRGYGRALLVMLILFVAIMVLLVPLGVMLAASGIDLSFLASGQAPMADPEISPGLGLSIGFYGLLFLIVGLFAASRLTTLYPVLLAEGRGPGAIARSFAVTRGLTWKLVGIWLLFLVVFAVAAGAARSVTGVVAGLLFPAEGAFTPAAVVGALVGALVTTLFALIVAAFSAKLYRAAAPTAAGAADRA